MDSPAPAPKRHCTRDSDKAVETDAVSSAGQGSSDDACFSFSQRQSVEKNSKKISGMDLQDLLVIELCAGTARLTKTIRTHGMRGLAVDKSKDRGCGTEIMILDLTRDHDL